MSQFVFQKDLVMSQRLKSIKERSRLRKNLLVQQLGVGSIEKLRSSLGLIDQDDPAKCRKKNNKSKKITADKEKDSSGSRSVSKLEEISKSATEDPNPLVYTDSSTFLKSTHYDNSNPHNDYCQHFVDTGQRPQNFIRDVGLADRFEEYPKARELIRLKDELIQSTATPPMYLKTDLSTFSLPSLGTKFDVILVEPPLEEYNDQRSRGGGGEQGFWQWEQIMNLDIGSIAAARSFIFIWCGSSEGLDHGRTALRRWGFRRCEDICWIRTNVKNPGHSKNLEAKAVFQRTKEHCLMGIKGTVRRSTDGDFIHANVDIDLIITEEEEYGSHLEKPAEIFNIIEHFCLGRRRLHLFGRDSTIRPGWLTIGSQLTHDNFNAETYAQYFTPSTLTTGCTEKIESLRPKSPPPRSRGGGGAKY